MTRRKIFICVCVLLHCLLLPSLLHGAPATSPPNVPKNQVPVQPKVTQQQPPQRQAPPVKAPTKTIDPDFEAMRFSPEEEDLFIIQPLNAVEESTRSSTPSPSPPPVNVNAATQPQKPSQTSTTTSTQTASTGSTKPTSSSASSPSTSAAQPTRQAEPSNLVAVDVSSSTALADLCRQLPSVAASSGSTGASVLSLSYISRLLHAFFIESHLLSSTAQPGDSLVRLAIPPHEFQLLRSAFLRATASTSSKMHSQPMLAEEDLPEIMKATLEVISSMEVENESLLCATGLEDEAGGSNTATSASAAASLSASIWGRIRKGLQWLSLVPRGEEELGMFYGFLATLAAIVASMGLGFAWGVRSDQKSILGAVSHKVNHGDSQLINSSSNESIRQNLRARAPRKIFMENFCRVMTWLFLLVVVIFLISYAHCFLQTLHENQLRQSLNQSKPVPKECHMNAEEIEHKKSLVMRIQDALGMDTDRHARTIEQKCERYWREYYASTIPNPLFVLNQFVTQSITTPLALVFDTLGMGFAAVLSHHSWLTQVFLMAFAVIFLWGLAWMGSMSSLLCCFTCCSRSGSSSRKRRLKGGRRSHVEIEEVSDEDDETDDDGDSNLKQRLALLERRERKRLEDENSLMKRRLLLLEASHDSQQSPEAQYQSYANQHARSPVVPLIQGGAKASPISPPQHSKKSQQPSNSSNRKNKQPHPPSQQQLFNDSEAPPSPIPAPDLDEVKED